MAKTYTVEVVCRNCGWKGLVEFKLGKTVASKPCPTCSCKRLIKGYSGRTVPSESN